MWKALRVATVFSCVLLQFLATSTQTLAQQSAPDATEFAGAVQAAETMPRIKSLLISRNGESVVERYFNDTSARNIANIKSISKSVVSALVGIAIGQGYIEGVDQPIGEYFTAELSADGDNPKVGITIGNLLTMQSGLETTSNRNYGAWVLSSNWVAASLRRRATSTRENDRSYGYGWWIREMAGHETPYAWGYGGQFIVLVPDFDLVVVTTSSSYPGPDRRAHTRRMYDLVEHAVVAPVSARMARAAPLPSEILPGGE